MKKFWGLTIVIILVWAGVAAGSGMNGGLPPCDNSTYSTGTSTSCAGTPANAKVELDLKLDTSAAVEITDPTTTGPKYFLDGTPDTWENAVLAIDAHTDNTQIALVPGICPIIHNTGQGAGDVHFDIPALAEGLCFMIQGRATVAGNYFRGVPASANTVNLNGTSTGKDYIQLTTVVIDDVIACFASGTDHWNCQSKSALAAAGDL